MGLLGVLHLAVVDARGIRDVLGAVDARGRRTRGVEALLGQRRGVGTHIGNVTVLVEALCDAHGALRGEVQAAAGLLLERRGHKRRVRLAGVRLVLDVCDVHGAAFKARGELYRQGLVHDGNFVRLELATVVEVAAERDAAAFDGGKTRLELRGVAGQRSELGAQVPIVGGDERHALALTLDDDAGRNGLDAAGGQARHDLLPQHRGDLVAVETVKNTAGFLRVDEVDVQVTGVFRGLEDGGLGDLVEDHAAHRHLGLEHLEQVPRDGLALAVRVCCEVELVALLELGFKVRDLLLLVRGDDVERREVVLGVDAKAGPGFFLIGSRNVGSTAGKIADVPDGGLDDVVVAEIRLNLLRLRRRLHNHQGLSLASSCCHLLFIPFARTRSLLRMKNL